MEAAVTHGFKGRSKAVQDRDDFLKKLEDFPHLFKLDFSKLTKSRIKSIYDRVCREQNDPFKSREEEVNRDINLKAVLLFSMDDVDEAIQMTETVLDTTERGNIVALGNMAVMLWMKTNRADGEKFAQSLEKLKERSDFQGKIAEGKAEMAYCYSRMGIAFAAQAVELFDDVIQHVPDKYFWKFGLALVLRRFTHLNFKAYYRLNTETSTDHNMKSFELFFGNRKLYASLRSESTRVG